ncbi:hypothetical protein PWT90_09246 [Aphanocladium album]|nr:hypothetical protein PWT90_09246 [Aphanocladium album]
MRRRGRFSEFYQWSDGNKAATWSPEPTLPHLSSQCYTEPPLSFGCLVELKIHLHVTPLSFFASGSWFLVLCLAIAPTTSGPNHANQSNPLQSLPDLLKWLDEFQNKRGSTTHNTSALQSTSSNLGGNSAPALCLVRDTASGLNRSRTDADALVLGLCQTPRVSPQEDEALLDFLGASMRVFAARPERRFLLSFRLYNFTMEAWTFDRAGAYSGRTFDIVQEPHRFGHVILRYLRMNDFELSLNPILQHDSQGVFLELGGPRLSVEDEAFVKQDYLVGPGTSCFKAHTPDSTDPCLVVRFAWEQGEVSAEQTLLAFANERHVWGGCLGLKAAGTWTTFQVFSRVV